MAIYSRATPLKHGNHTTKKPISDIMNEPRSIITMETR